MSSDWSGTKAILSEVSALFHQEDDLKEIEEVNKMRAEIEAHTSAHLKDARELIKSYTAQVADLEKDILAPTEVAHASQLEKFRVDKENVAGQVEQVRGEMDTKREKIAELAQQGLELVGKCSQTTAASQMADSRTAYALSLYAKISNISWDYKAPNGKIAGTIGSDETSSLRHFELDTRKKTSFETANDLWDMIGDNVSN
jgi:hypothetical protein